LAIGAWLASVSMRMSLSCGVCAKASLQYRPATSPLKKPVSSSAAGLRVTTRPSRSTETMPFVSEARMLSVYDLRSTSSTTCRRKAAQEQHGERERTELDPGLADLGLHPLLGEPHADRAPLPPLHLDRKGEVVDRLPPRRHRLLDEELARPGRPPVRGPLQDRP